MRVTVNGEAHTLPDEATVEDLTRHLRMEGRIALEINREVVPRSRWTDRALHNGDTVEVVRAIGGG